MAGSADALADATPEYCVVSVLIRLAVVQASGGAYMYSNHG